MPEVGRHFSNNAAWLDVIGRENGKLGKRQFFRGIVLTGWSRYDHFAVLCELVTNEFICALL